MQYGHSGMLVRPGHRFNGVKIVSATMMADRSQLGEKVTAWMTNNPNLAVVEIVVSQSSDASFHCISFAIFYWDPAAAKVAAA